MNIFVSVGTTPFPSLVREAHRVFSVPHICLTMQTAVPFSFGSSSRFFEFSDNIYDYYNSADVVICHAGAGTVYKLLEMEKKIVVVPNIERRDQHQLELARFIERSGYGVVCWNVSNLKNAVEKVLSFPATKYQHDSFFKFDEIRELVNNF